MTDPASLPAQFPARARDAGPRTMREASSSRYEPRATAPRSGSGLRLFCLPHAGAGASAYREWIPALAPGITVVPVQLPGREHRFAEPPLRSVDAMVDDVLGSILSEADTPFAIFGHSMGALVGYELTAALVDRGRAPVCTIVSGHPAPHLERTDPPVHTLPHDAFVRHVCGLNGIPEEILADPELVELLVPVLRADFAVCETYRYRARVPLPVPFLVLAGRDDVSITEARLRAWQELTAASARVQLFDGGHFYLREHLTPTIEAVKAALKSPVR